MYITISRKLIEIAYRRTENDPENAQKTSVGDCMPRIEACYLLFGKNRYETDLEKANDCLNLELNDKTIFLTTRLVDQPTRLSITA